MDTESNDENVAVLWKRQSGYLIVNAVSLEKLLDEVHGLEDMLGYQQIGVYSPAKADTYQNLSQYVSTLDKKKKVSYKDIAKRLP